ncbi:MAG: L-histidine N(alpha)-methyltransferase [Microscillaceae bacterium]|nr:L-histidine N(alpha)-methyltransferase [Microscillaceae bacterium]
MNLAFAEDLRRGLTADPKFIPSKYFYDAQGSRIFQEIMRLEEYYLTQCEFEILQLYAPELLEFFAPDGAPFEMIEFGAGDGLKTKLLLNHFLESEADFKYLPIDISKDALQTLVDELAQQYPNLDVEGQPNEYFTALRQLSQQKVVRRVVLFLGSNIGNFHYDQGIAFLSELRQCLRPGDFVLMGMDLKKNPEIILNAYNDRQGVTRAFNLNLLNRINREMEADFNLAQFHHYPVYDPIEGGAKSYLMSRVKQTVLLRRLALKVELEAWEAIHTESSYKYTPYRIGIMAKTAGFEVVRNFLDRRHYFTDSLWKAI